MLMFDIECIIVYAAEECVLFVAINKKGVTEWMERVERAEATA